MKTHEKMVRIINRLFRDIEFDREATRLIRIKKVVRGIERIIKNG